MQGLVYLVVNVVVWLLKVLDRVLLNRILWNYYVL